MNNKNKMYLFKIMLVYNHFFLFLAFSAAFCSASSLASLSRINLYLKSFFNLAIYDLLSLTNSYVRFNSTTCVSKSSNYFIIRIHKLLIISLNSVNIN
jgi:hypothetical protein